MKMNVNCKTETMPFVTLKKCLSFVFYTQSFRSEAEKKIKKKESKSLSLSLFSPTAAP